MNSSDNFLMCRRFDFLHTRVLLHRQDELAEMEKALIAMDDEDQELDQLSLESRRRDDQRPEEPSRKSLMTKIDGKLKDYGMNSHRFPLGPKSDPNCRRSNHANQKECSNSSSVGSGLW